jgi:hypothetical protein
VHPGRHDVDGDDDFAEIWRSAQHRRSKDVYFWFTNIFKKRWLFRSPSRYVGLPFRPFTHKALLRSEIEQAPFKGAESKGGRGGQ